MPHVSRRIASERKSQLRCGRYSSVAIHSVVGRRKMWGQRVSSAPWKPLAAAGVVCLVLVAGLVLTVPSPGDGLRGARKARDAALPPRVAVATDDGDAAPQPVIRPEITAAVTARPSSSSSSKNGRPSAKGSDGTRSALEVVVITITGLPAPNTVKIALRPDLSNTSVAYVRAVAMRRCGGKLYRAEQNLLVQGRFDCKPDPNRSSLPMVRKGTCPPGVKADASRKCPAHDPQCGCHGPIMTRGMVGWAGGATGPDFFVFTGSFGPAVHWAHDHTVVGEVADASSWRVLERVLALPASRGAGGMTMLRSPAAFTVAPDDA